MVATTATDATSATPACEATPLPTRRRVVENEKEARWQTRARGGREKIVEANFRRDDDDNLNARDATRRGGESAFERTVVDSKL